MATYSKKTCHKCGIRLPQPDMIAKIIQVETGNSRKTLSGSELFFAVLGNEKAKKAVGRTFTSPNKRRYLRNKDVWECYNCAGVETPEEKRIRLENERIANDNVLRERSILQAQQQAAWQLRQAEKAERLAIQKAERKERQEEKAERLAVARSNRRRDGSFTRFLLAFVPQFLLSFIIIYIPISEFYLRRFGLSGLKFLSFYVAVIFIAANTSDEQFGLVFTVPLVMGVIDLVSGFIFFRRKIQPDCIQMQTQASSSPSLPPPLPTNESGDGIFIADKQNTPDKQNTLMENHDLASLKEQLVKEYQADPRNKIHINLEMLTLSANEETDEKRKPSEINKIIEKYTNGDLDDAEEEIYDGAVAVCGSLASHCFAGDPDAEVDYEIDWLEGDEGYFAEVRPN